MQNVLFHWDRENITPRLLIAVGSVTLTWAMIDTDISRALLLFWCQDKPDEPPPRSFDRRIASLMRYAEALYVNEPDERRTFRWYAQRLKQANGLRDSVAHGQPGKITKGRRTYFGLMVPQPSGRTQYVPMKISDVERLAETLGNLHAETVVVSHALWAAQTASSPNRQSFSQIHGKWTKLTKENRSPRLPRWHPPPSTFRG